MLSARDYLTRDRRVRRILRLLQARDPERLPTPPDKPDPLPSAPRPESPKPAHPSPGVDSE